MSLGNYVPVIESKKLGKLLDKTGVMMKVVNRSYEGEIKSEGDSVNITTPGEILVRKYAGTVTKQKPTSTQQQLLIDQADYFSFEISKIEQAQSHTDLIPVYRDRAKVSIELNRDSFLLAKVADAHSDNTISTSVATKDNIYGKIVGAHTKLKMSNALNKGEKAWMILNPELVQLLYQAPEFTQAHNMGEDVIKNGAIAKVNGMMIYECTNFVDASGTYNVMFGTNDAITFASQVVDMEKYKQDFRTTVQGLYVYGAKVILPKALGKLVLTLA